MLGSLFSKVSSFFWGTSVPQQSTGDELVVAEDGEIYKRAIIEKWFEDLESAGQPIISPCTSAFMGKTLVSTAVDLGDLQRKKVECVTDFMNEQKVDPVQADDEHVYSRAVIEAWYLACGQSRKVLKSPIDGRRVTNRLVSVDLDDVLFRNKRTEMIAAYNAMTSIQDLGDIFVHLDRCKDLLRETLQGWAIPCVIVFGGEKVGKSSLIERMTMMNIFPRDHRMTCTTRMPIIAHLRRSDVAANPYLEVVRENGEVVEGTKKFFNLNNGAETVREAMDAYVQTGMTYEYSLSLHIQTPDVPTLDMIDLPGIISNKLNGEPADIVDTSKEITRRYIQRYRDRAIFLAVVPCTKQIRQDVSLGIVEELGIEV